MNDITVSVVVPCRNEILHIESCVRSILLQDLDGGHLEIIVVDGMSRDGTREQLNQLTREDRRVRVVDNPQCITPCAMNIGIQESQGQYVAIMGAHNRYAPDYLRQSIRVLQETGADNVGGAMICESQSRVQMAIGESHHHPFSVGGALWHNPNYEGETDTVFGGVYRREVFSAIGLFDEELIRNQDDEFNLRLKKTGGKIWQSPRIKSWYNPRTNLKDLFRQYFEYGYWKVRVIQKHKKPSSFRHLVPGIFVGILGMLPVLSFWWPLMFWFWLGIVGSYIGLNIMVSLKISFCTSRTIFSILPFVFACYHFGYGLGFLRGIWDFIFFQNSRRKKLAIQRDS
ncbi:MAG: glycosyltransferase family 2 protein [Nitrospirae bacterium]|nr:glycosyltransferase family 2 protein [Nitrospirota bacterium]